MEASAHIDLIRHFCKGLSHEEYIACTPLSQIARSAGPVCKRLEELVDYLIDIERQKEKPNPNRLNRYFWLDCFDPNNPLDDD